MVCNYMSLDEKLSRLRKLYKIQYPSDQELEEANQLEDEIKLILEESYVKIKPQEPEEKPQSEPVKKQRGIIQKLLFIKPKEPPKPVTEAELLDLTMQARKEEIKARIAKAKAQQQKSGGNKSIFDTIQKVIGKSSNNPFDVSENRGSKKRSDYDPFRW